MLPQVEDYSGSYQEAVYDKGRPLPSKYLWIMLMSWATTALYLCTIAAYLRLSYLLMPTSHNFSLAVVLRERLQEGMGYSSLGDVWSCTLLGPVEAVWKLQRVAPPYYYKLCTSDPVPLRLLDKGVAILCCTAKRIYVDSLLRLPRFCLEASGARVTFCQVKLNTLPYCGAGIVVSCALEAIVKLLAGSYVSLNSRNSGSVTRLTTSLVLYASLTALLAKVLSPLRLQVY